MSTIQQTLRSVGTPYSSSVSAPVKETSQRAMREIANRAPRLGPEARQAAARTFATESFGSEVAARLFD
ncbi:hypothetical protein [Hydrogenophaga sp.]|uniref:hypothetical protein n=1 Tax=Hydrogenophaga sp. TaxID=1904254 RepID=UPI0025BA97BF|nr:hypothetical protein [Hydrogenophaga sp.]